MIVVYPRACGGTLTCLVCGDLAPGLSPRLRGNRDADGLPHSARGSIPAPAGEPRPRTR